MKERITAAAVEEIRRRGLKFSMRDIAARLGMSSKTIYQHFESKEQLIGFILDNALAEMKELEQALYRNPELTYRDRLMEALVLIPRGFAFTDLRTLNELRTGYHGLWIRLDGYFNESWDNIRILMKDGIERGELRPFDIELFIRVYDGALYHLMDLSSAGVGMTLEEAMNGMVNLLLQGIYP
jgi:AcrR family transcriptional regulator